jgi:hypothetical protein
MVALYKHKFGRFALCSPNRSFTDAFTGMGALSKEDGLGQEDMEDIMDDVFVTL